METVKIRDMRSDEQRKKDDEEFKAAVQKEKEYAEKRKNAEKVGKALDHMRGQINLSVFRSIRTDREVRSVAEEALIFFNWAKRKLGYDLKEAKEMYRKDGKKLSEKLYKEGLRKAT